MFQTLFSNTFGSPTRVKRDISRKCRDTALSRRHSPLYSKSILSFTSQNTLLKTSLRHFPITYEAVTDTFMSATTHRNTHPAFSRPHTSIYSRYTTICKSQAGVIIRVQVKTWFNGCVWKSFDNTSKRVLCIRIHKQVMFKI